jgi:hypothetical protein
MGCPRGANCHLAYGRQVPLMKRGIRPGGPDAADYGLAAWLKAPMLLNEKLASPTLIHREGIPEDRWYESAQIGQMPDSESTYGEGCEFDHHGKQHWSAGIGCCLHGSAGVGDRHVSVVGKEKARWNLRIEGHRIQPCAAAHSSTSRRICSLSFLSRSALFSTCAIC